MFVRLRAFMAMAAALLLAGCAATDQADTNSNSSVPILSNRGQCIIVITQPSEDRPADTATAYIRLSGTPKRVKANVDVDSPARDLLGLTVKVTPASPLSDRDRRATGRSASLYTEWLGPPRANSWTNFSVRVNISVSGLEKEPRSCWAYDLNPG
jgi:hypothetical protein